MVQALPTPGRTRGGEVASGCRRALNGIFRRSARYLTVSPCQDIKLPRLFGPSGEVSTLCQQLRNERVTRATGPATTDADLVRRVLEKDPAACRQMVRRVTSVAERPIRRVLLRSARRAEASSLQALKEDALQELLLTLFKDDAALLRRFDPEKNERLDPYVTAIARHVTMNVASKDGRRARREVMDDLETLERLPSETRPSDPQTLAEASELAEVLLRELEPDERDKVLAYFLDRMSAKEVAARFGGKEHAVHVWANRMRQRLQRRHAEILGPLE